MELWIVYVMTVDVLHYKGKVKWKFLLFHKGDTAFCACINRHRILWNWLCLVIKSKLLILGTVKKRIKNEIFPKEATAFTACINRHIILHRTLWNWLCLVIKSNKSYWSSEHHHKEPRMQHVTERMNLSVFNCVPDSQHWLSCIPKWKLENLIKKQFKYFVNRTTQYTEWKINDRICATYLLTSNCHLFLTFLGGDGPDKQFSNLPSRALTRPFMLYKAKYDLMKPIVQCTSCTYIPSSSSIFQAAIDQTNNLAIYILTLWRGRQWFARLAKQTQSFSVPHVLFLKLFRTRWYLQTINRF